MYCIAKGCKSNYAPHSDVKFHTFPKDIERRNLWLNIVPLKTKFYQSARLCNNHFLPQDYDPNRPGHLLNTAKPFYNEDYQLSQSNLYGNQESSSKSIPDCSSFLCSSYDDGDKMIETDILVQETTEEKDAATCCACLSKQTFYQPLKDLTLKAYTNLTGLTPTKMSNDICDICTELLKKSDEFRNQCIESYHKLNAITLTENSDTVTDYDFEVSVVKKTDSDDDGINDTSEFEPYSNDFDSSDDKPLNYEPIKIKDENITETIFTEELKIEKTPRKSSRKVKSKTKSSKSKSVKSKSGRKTKNEQAKYEQVSKFEQLTKSEPEVKKKRVRTVDPNKVFNKKITEFDEALMKFFEVKTLTKNEQLEEFSKRKNTNNYQNAKYKCELCFRGFTIEDAYSNHMQLHTDKQGLFVCEICHTRCTSAIRLGKHQRAMHQRVFICKLCEFRSSNRGTSTLHMNWHNGKKYECKHCGKLFNRLQSQQLHIRIKHPDEDNVCGFCGYSFSGKMGLKLHINLKHRDFEKIPVDGPKCDECNITFANDEALSAHTATSKKHGGKKQNFFDVHKLYMKGSNSVKKKKELRIERSFDITCEQCGELLPSMRTYKFHFNKYHSNCTLTKYPEDYDSPHLCFICGKTYTTYTALYTHLNSHEIPGEEYKCDTCGEIFKTRDNIKRHMLEHTGKKLTNKKPNMGFPCTICHRVFNQRTNMYRHRNFAHSDVKNEKCDFCEKTFKSRAEKKSHEDYVHLKKPYRKRNRGNRPVGHEDGFMDDLVPLARDLI